MITLGELRERLEIEEPWDLPSTGSAWYISLIMGVGAWLAALFLVIVLAIAGVLTSPEACVVCGLVGVGASILLRWNPTVEFLQQLALAGLVSGELMVVGGFFNQNFLIWGLPSLLFLCLPLALFRDRAGRMLTALIMGGMVLAMVGMDENGTVPLEVWCLGLALLAGFCWLGQLRLLAGPYGDVQPALGYASVITLFGLFEAAYWDWFRHRELGAGATLLLTAAVLWMAARVQRDLKLPLGKGVFILAAVVALGGLTWSAPGIMAGVGVLMLGFAASDRVLQGMAWAYLLAFGSTFYYELTISLLAKSGVLIASGLLFLALWKAVRRA